MSGLIDTHGAPLRVPGKSVLTGEISGPTTSGVRSHLTGYPANGLTPLRLGNILRAADMGDPIRFLELAELIEERDLHYAGILQTRKRSVSQLDISVEPASDSAVHEQHAQQVRDWLSRDELTEELFDILDATGKGYSLTEIMWEISAGQYRPSRLEYRDPRWFRFDRIDGKTPMLITESGQEEPLPPFKFIFAKISAKSGLPIRSGIARLAVWAWMFKAYTNRDWTIFTQTYGQPIRVGKYGAGATEEQKATLLRAVSNIAGDCAAIIPDGMSMEFIESKSLGSSSNLYKDRADWLDQQMSKAVLGQTTTTDAINGGHAVSQEHRQVAEDIERADCKALSAILNRDLVRPWMMLDHGETEHFPRIKIGRPETEDIQQLTEAVTKLVPLGFRVSQEEMRDKLNLKKPGDSDEVLTAPAQVPEAQAATQNGDGAPGPASATAAPARVDLNDAGAPVARDQVSKVDPAPAQDMLDEITAAVDAATSLEDLRDRLTALKSTLSRERYATAVRAAMLKAQLEGRLEIADGP